MAFNPENQSSIIQAWKDGELSDEQALEALTAYWIDQGGQLPADAAVNAQSILDAELAAAGKEGGTPEPPGPPKPPGPGQGPIPGPAGTVGKGSPFPFPLNDAATELATDPLTAYLQRLGIGGKTAYNPAERYQASLFDPLKSLYDVNQRLYSPGSQLAKGGKEYGTFADYLTGIGGGGPDYQMPLYATARRQLQDIFGATPEARESAGASYEPGRFEEGSEGALRGTPDRNNLQELQELLRLGLRTQSGALGARFAASRLPQAQQAYYGQRAAGGAAPDSNFLDWLKTNWGMSF